MEGAREAVLGKEPGNDSEDIISDTDQVRLLNASRCRRKTLENGGCMVSRHKERGLNMVVEALLVAEQKGSFTNKPSTEEYSAALHTSPVIRRVGKGHDYVHRLHVVVIIA